MAGTSGGDARALATLALRTGPKIGSELEVRQPVVSIGRSAKCEIDIDDDSISTVHARLEYDRDGWWLTDLGSANGTFVEGVRLAPEVPTPLTYGSTVRFGTVQTHFRPVAGADPDAARDSYRPTPPPPRIIERRRGARLPLWIVLLVMIVIVVAAVWFGLVWSPEPEPAPVPGGAMGVVTGAWTPPAA